MMNYSLQGFPGWEFAANQYMFFCTDMQTVTNLRHIPFTVEGMAPEQGWILAHAERAAHAALRWAELVELKAQFLSHAVLMAPPLPSPRQHRVLFPCTGTYKHSIWFYQYKVIQVSRISPFYRIKTIFSPVFYSHLLSTPTAPGGRSNGQLSCFWRWGLQPLYYQHPMVRTTSKIYTRMRSRKCQFYMKRKPRFEDFSL